MTAWPTERAAILNMIDHFGDGTFAIVMDSYDYNEALAKVLPSVKQKKVGKGGYMVLRPDSGDPVESVLQVAPPSSHWACQKGKKQNDSEHQGFHCWLVVCSFVGHPFCWAVSTLHCDHTRLSCHWSRCHDHTMLL
jgi:nicotinic acid phosphoribosyltransferase